MEHKNIFDGYLMKFQVYTKIVLVVGTLCFFILDRAHDSLGVQIFFVATMVIVLFIVDRFFRTPVKIIIDPQQILLRGGGGHGQTFKRTEIKIKIGLETNKRILLAKENVLRGEKLIILNIISNDGRTVYVLMKWKDVAAFNDVLQLYNYSAVARFGDARVNYDDKSPEHTFMVKVMKVGVLVWAIFVAGVILLAILI